MGIFSKRISETFAARALPVPVRTGLTVSSSPAGAMQMFALEALDALTRDGIKALPLDRERALRVPGIKRAHGIHVTEFAQVPFYAMDGDARAETQPEWLTTSRSGLAPYQRMFGLGSDLFFYGWGVLGFTAEKDDCLHIPFGQWKLGDDGIVRVTSDAVPLEYQSMLVPINLGIGENGVLVDGADTINEAIAIEDAYQKRLADPVPLTILNIPNDDYFGLTVEERTAYRDQWVEGRRKSSTALKVAEWGVDMPGQVAVDLYETGRNAVRLDIANHTSTPASMLEGAHQGGSGTSNINYTGVANGADRSELWDYGLAKRMLLAFEARMSLDDIVPAGQSIRGDRAAFITTPTPNTTPTSED